MIEYFAKKHQEYLDAWQSPHTDVAVYFGGHGRGLPAAYAENGGCRGRLRRGNGEHLEKKDARGRPFIYASGTEPGCIIGDISI